MVDLSEGWGANGLLWPRSIAIGRAYDTNVIRVYIGEALGKIWRVDVNATEDTIRTTRYFYMRDLRCDPFLVYLRQCCLPITLVTGHHTSFDQWSQITVLKDITRNLLYIQVLLINSVKGRYRLIAHAFAIYIINITTALSSSTC